MVQENANARERPENRRRSVNPRVRVVAAARRGHISGNGHHGAVRAQVALVGPGHVFRRFTREEPEAQTPLVLPHDPTEPTPAGYTHNMVSGSHVIDTIDEQAPFDVLTMRVNHGLSSIMPFCPVSELPALAGTIREQGLMGLAQLSARPECQHAINAIWQEPVGNRIAPVVTLYAEQALSSFHVITANFTVRKDIALREFELEVVPKANISNQRPPSVQLRVKLVYAASFWPCLSESR